MSDSSLNQACVVLEYLPSFEVTLTLYEVGGRSFFSINYHYSVVRRIGLRMDLLELDVAGQTSPLSTSHSPRSTIMPPTAELFSALPVATKLPLRKVA